ncbi:MAG TPA: phosphoglycolate phosphatase [Xanthomonadaceae bacterium]|nr:phosphoglycolate phosphatase [Xanthomonadaceae bacterium]
MSGAIAPLVLFDLDGTLVDSAPDLLTSLNRLLAEHHRPAVEAARLRPVVSKGGMAMLGIGFPELAEPGRKALLPRFLGLYAQTIAVNSAPFDGIAEVLEAITSAGSRWGVVTNKPEALALALLEGLAMRADCAVLIGGDTLPERKPHPLPLREACARLGMSVIQAVYVGDDERDILAARAAPMPSVAALWGYRLDHEHVADWNADRLAAEPRELLAPGCLACAG